MCLYNKKGVQWNEAGVNQVWKVTFAQRTLIQLNAIYLLVGLKVCNFVYDVNIPTQSYQQLVQVLV